MKLWWKVILGLAVLAAISALLRLRPDDRPQKAVAETRQLLRQQGFKTDLSEFDFSASEEFRARVAALTNAVWITEPGSRKEAALRVQKVQHLRCWQRPVLLPLLGVNRQPIVLLLGLCLRLRARRFRNCVVVQLFRIPEPFIDVLVFRFHGVFFVLLFRLSVAFT